jgi:hypothetical protein
MRRVAHLALFAGLIVGVRACGGAQAVGDRLSATARWVGERTGIQSLQQTVRSEVAPAMTGATKAAGRRTQQAVSDALHRAGADAKDVRANLRSAAAATAATIGKTQTALLGDAGQSGSTSSPSADESSRSAREPKSD